MEIEPMNPAYRIRTPRTSLRCWSPDDAPKLKAAIDRSLEHLRPWIPWAVHEPSGVEQIAQRLRGFRAQFDRDEGYILAVFNPDESLVLGGTGLHKRVGPCALEVGYWIHKDHIGHGLATEISAALTRVAFEAHRVQRVEIRCDPENARSAAVPAKLGFTRETVLRHHDKNLQGQPRDTVVWAMVRTDYESSPAARIAIEAYDCMGSRII